MIFLIHSLMNHCWASTLMIIIFFGGVQLLTLGIVGEYISIIFDEVKGRPEYVVDERVNVGLKIQDSRFKFQD